MLSYKLASFWRLLRNKTLLKDPSSIADLRSCSKTLTVAGSGVTKPEETLIVMPCLPEAGGAERQCSFKLTKITKKSSKQKELFEDLKICRSVGTSCTRSGSTAEFPKDSKTNSCSNYFTWARQFTFVRHCLLNGPDKNQLLWGEKWKDCISTYRFGRHEKCWETRASKPTFVYSSKHVCGLMSLSYVSGPLFPRLWISHVCFF